jgi:hypothetical protein
MEGSKQVFDAGFFFEKRLCLLRVIPEILCYEFFIKGFKVF